jgi:gamma-glutamyltranspeptidase/glutathione hydrolase
MRAYRVIAIAFVACAALPPAWGGSEPIRTLEGLVITASAPASRVGAAILEAGGNAMDASVATAFALAVTHPSAGNIGGGGFLVYRSAPGEAAAYDFRETAPAAAKPEMFLTDGQYDFSKHHKGHLSVGVPGTVAGLHLAWKDHGKLEWRRLIEPAIALARDGFPLSVDLARALRDEMEAMKPYAASVAQFTKAGVPYEPGETLRQPDLARTLERIAAHGPADFYEGETARLIEAEMKARGGLVTRADLKGYRAMKRVPLRGQYRGYEIIAMPPPSSGGVALVQMLNILEGYDLKSMGYGSAQSVHLIAEAMRRAFADRALNLGDPEFNPRMPLERLTSKAYAGELRATIDPAKASVSSPQSFTWRRESAETTHFSVVDAQRNAVSLTYTLEWGYGSRIVVPGAGFLLNNEMGDFNGAPGVTNDKGLVGTPPNLAQPGKRMLSSMSPTIVAKDGKLFMVTGSPGGRTIINTVLQTILYAVDFGMNAQEAVDAGRIHHQWLPDRISHERFAFSPDTLGLLKSRGHQLREISSQGAAEVIVLDAGTDTLEGGFDRREPDGLAAASR